VIEENPVNLVPLSRSMSECSGREARAAAKRARDQQLESTEPGTPSNSYRVSGNGTSGPPNRNATHEVFLRFVAARAIARNLKLKGCKEWYALSKSGQRPSNIPAHPETTYRDDGWISWPDWLGSERRVLAKDMLPFTVAKAIVRQLKLKSEKEWVAWRKSDQRPSNIPSNPSKVYRDDGWISWPDWLGNGGTPMNSMVPFAVGRAYVLKLKLRGAKEFVEWSKSGERPSNIPSNPSQAYRDDGWVSWPDWLGNGKERAGTWKSFTEARAYVRKLKLRGQKEWWAWSKSGHRPSNIPSSPDQMYRDDGWISYPDWLGYGSEGGGAAASRSSSSSSTSTAPKEKKKRKRRPNAPPPSQPPPPPAPHPKCRVKTDESRTSEASGDSRTTSDPPLHKVKAEFEA
jgi:hypothetical protein